MPYDYKAKQKNVNQLNNYMLAKTLSMFEYEGLPETIPSRELEKLLQKKGYAFITKAPDGQLYAFSGGLGGESDVYGNPTQITIANPALKFNKTLDVKKDGVLIFNDDMANGLLPFFEKQNTLIAENEINMVVWGYNSRTQKLISAPDDKTKESADLYVKKIIEGDISVIGENILFDGVKVQPANNSSGNNVSQMIEYHQYIKSCLFNEVGLPSNFNMKKERLISSEIDQAEDSLFPLVYNMMENRIAAVNLINEMFGTDIKVGFGSVWALKNKKLVDGIVDDNGLPDETNTGENDVNNGSANNDDNGKSNETESGAEQDKSREPEATDTNAESGNGNDNGGEGSASESGVNTDSDNEPDNNPDNENGGNEDEQGQRQSDNQDNSENSGNDSESEKQIADLQAIIDNPESSEDDKKAARELLAEIENKE